MQRILDSPLLVIAVAFVASALIGALVSLLAIFPPLRRLGRRSVGAAAAIVGLGALVALVLTFGLGTRLFAASMVAYVTEAEAGWRDYVPEGSDLERQLQAWDENIRAILNELWLRQMAPPASRTLCYTGQLTVCELMGELGVFGTSTWESWSLFVGLGVVSALVAGVLACLFLRRSPRRTSSLFAQDGV